MNLFTQILLSLASAGAATFAITQMQLSGLALGSAIAVATLVTPLLRQLGGSSSTPSNAGSADFSSDYSNDNGDREEGEVKWFNVSKGFGFIRRDNDEEIFVHFRSIRDNKGRRGLKDGQRVTYRVVESDKGPQAEDVEGL